MGEEQAVTVIVAAGSVASMLTLLLAIDRHRKIVTMASRLLELALAGRAQEARMQARNANPQMLPLVDALGGAVVAPERIPLTQDVLSILALLGPPLVLASYFGWSTFTGHGTSSAVISALLSGLAVLLSICVASAIVVIGLGQHAARFVRASSVALLARNVKSSVDAEAAESIRRAHPPRDPRVE